MTVAAASESRARRILRYSCRALALVVLLLWAVPVGSSLVVATRVGRSTEPAPTSGDFYLSNYSSTVLTCYVTPDHGQSTTVELQPIRSIWRFTGLLGTKVERDFDGPAEVACSPSPPEARMNSGPLVALFPIAGGIELPIVALILAAFGWTGWRSRLFKA